ncbi:uncharacterized protein Obp50b isoform X1 [Drosophila pseudoobscura]|uniref:Uncharacterized protein Obp50b isoform X1 n=1 Tax=Drosophila pseudoobscura pseudoobscura TaxID=46245 RepID=A0A6I8V4D7_DROPS|nr:uncharacterized protein LOC6898273 isoform X1 [Drosophila pseudoobscura]
MPVLWLLCCMGMLLVSVARGEILDMGNCSRLFNTKTLDWCCGKNILSMFAFVGTNCTTYLNDYGPCRYDCIFNHWGIRDETKFKLKMPELFMMITKLYSPLNGYHSYGVALKMAYETCDRLGTKYADFIMLYSAHIQDTLGQDNFTSNAPFKDCSPFSMYHAQCAAIYLMLECPRRYWQPDAPECNILKETVRSCVRLFEEGTLPKSDPEPKSSGSRLYTVGLLAFLASVTCTYFQLHICSESFV